MLKTYFLTSWRHLLRNKVYAAINILGLSLGIACAILIFVLVRYHLSFDTFHKDPEGIYRVITELHNETVDRIGAVPGPLGKAIRNDYTFFDQVARITTYNDKLISLPKEKEVRKFQEENGVAFVDPSFFGIFHFPFLEGRPGNLSEPQAAVITEGRALKYFGTVHAIGRTIRFNNKTDFVVSGILKDLPANTDRREEIYLSYERLKDHDPFIASDSSWGGVYSGCQCYVRLKPGVTRAQVEKAFWPGFSKKYYQGDDVNAWRFKLQPLRDIHFDTDLDGYADIKYLWAIAFVGLFLIVTACVNFVNLATAQALNRSREIGVRKVLGSEPLQIFWQFMSETALITLFALLIGLGLAWAALPEVNGLFQSQMSMDLFRSWSLPVFLVIALIAVVFLSGSYPGLVLARFRPALALKGKLDQRHIGGFSLRRILVVLQFAISQLLIIGTLVIARQIHFSEHSDLGFIKEGIVMVPLPVNDVVKMTTLRNRFLSVPGIDKATLCFAPPAAQSNNNTSIRYSGRAKDELWSINEKLADESYIPTFGLTLIAGRNIFHSDTIREYVVNETTVSKLHLSGPVEIIGHNIEIDGQSARVVGVVKDFYDHSFRGEIQPMAIMSQAHRYRNCAVKIRLNQIRPALASVERIWNQTYPDYVFADHFLDESIAKFYELDGIMLKLIEVFAGIAIFIGCLGLYGLVSFMAVRKTKEIGVRKVLGAGLSQILWLFGKEFTRLLGIAFLVAAPLAWWIMHRYLESFKYRIGIGWSVFVPALAGTFLIAALTVGYRSWKAATMQPVKSLRSE